MGIIAIIVGGIVSGLVYWFVQGNGMRAVDGVLADRRNAKLRLRSEANYRAAPVRSLKDPIDGAGVLMHLIAQARGTPTPEQEAAIEAELRKVVPEGDDLAARLAVIRHAATQATEAETAIDQLGPMLREKLDAAERADLERMLEAVAVVHGGPTDRQERLIARAVRVLAAEPG